MAPDGLVGLPVEGVMDLHLRKFPGTVIWQYEYVTRSPEAAMRKLYVEINEPWFDGHDFTNVENQATDLDALYLGKFPHDGAGPVTPAVEGEWARFVPEDLAVQMMQRFAPYNRAFGYT